MTLINSEIKWREKEEKRLRKDGQIIRRKSEKKAVWGILRL